MAAEAWLIAAGFLAGLINALAGGGPLLTLAALAAAGLDPRIANLTSTVALCLGQLLAGWRGRRGFGVLSRPGRRPILLLLLATAGGAGGGLLLLRTTPAGFAAIVPWLVLLATLLYAWGSGRPELAATRGLPTLALASALLLSATYGGYFGGGNSFIVLALLSLAGVRGHDGVEAKNVLVAGINSGAVLVFVASGEVAWGPALAVGIGGLFGSAAGSLLLPRIDATLLRPVIVISGLALAIWFFLA